MEQEVCWLAYSNTELHPDTFGIIDMFWDILNHNQIREKLKKP